MILMGVKSLNHIDYFEYSTDIKKKIFLNFLLKFIHIKKKKEEWSKKEKEDR